MLYGIFTLRYGREREGGRESARERERESEEGREVEGERCGEGDRERRRLLRNVQDTEYAIGRA